MATNDPPEYLSSVDTAWYRMESSINHANIGALLIFEESIDPDRLRERIDERLVGEFPRFRQRVVESNARLTRPRWEDDPNFALDDHLEVRRLPEPADRETLRKTAGRLMTEGLDLDRPLWKIHLLQGYRGGSALVAQIHHCMGDGFALARILLSIADEGHDLDASADRRSPSRSLAHRSLTERLVDRARESVAKPGALGEIGAQLGEFFRSLGHILTMPFDRKTPLKRRCTGRLDVAWTETYSLEEFKEIAHALDSTVNDLLLAGVTSAVRTFLAEANEDVDAFDVRALVPVNLRPARSIEEMEPVLGNEFGVVFLPLPTDRGEIDGRLAQLGETIARLKQSSEAVIGFGVLTAEGFVPAPVEQLVNDLLVRKASLVVSNVPGPKSRLRIVGRELTDLLFWVPHPAPHLGLGLSLISYAGRVNIGVRVDEVVGRDADWFVREIEQAFDELDRYASPDA